MRNEVRPREGLGCMLPLDRHLASCEFAAESVQPSCPGTRDLRAAHGGRDPSSLASKELGDSLRVTTSVRKPWVQFASIASCWA